VRVDVAGTLKEYREIVAALTPDIALVDLNLPDGNAIEILLYPPEEGKFPIVVMTSFGNEDEAVRAMKAGAMDYVVKSLGTFNEMPHTIERTMREWALRNQRKGAEEERRVLEERLRQSEKMEAIGQLAGGIAHDFNNQLAGIMGFAELLRDRLGDEGLRRYAENILKASKRAADLTRKLLAFARRDILAKAPTDVHAILGEVVALLQHSVDKRIDIQVSLDATSSVIPGDPGELQNAFLNLALNARDAMPQGGRLILGTTIFQHKRRKAGLDLAPGRYLHVAVTDTGIGMSAETKRHMFEPFFTMKGPGKGTGLGLASAYATVRGHMGDITVESEVGQGTTFHLYLPFGPAQPTEMEIVVPDIRCQASGSILLVDDEEVFRDLGAEILRGAGYRVHTCNNGEDALSAVDQSGPKFDLVILDLMMPRLGGRDTLVALRKVDPLIRVLLVSGFPRGGEAQLVMDEGAAGFLQKPFQRADLLHAVANALAPERGPKKDS
jgi:signal transduction histidine kinase